MAGIDTRQDLGPLLEGLDPEVSWELSQGIRLFESHNLVLRVEGRYGRALPFHAELLTGGTRASVTAEYHFPLFQVVPLQVRAEGPPG